MEHLERPEKYRPTPEDLEWSKGMLAIIKDKGVLAFPGAQLIYEVDHTNQKLTLLNTQLLTESFFAFVTHWQTVDVFGELGYKVVEMQPPHERLEPSN